MILNINKHKGVSSFNIVKSIRYITKEKKVGHGGTLDPFAEGVLIVGTGKDTKKLTNITNEDKSYLATIKLGFATNTLDTYGKIFKEKEVPNLDEKIISKILLTFMGNTMQTPPMFSAKKIAGKKLYELARNNIVIKRDPVEINISKITLIDFLYDKITFDVTCSKGTYIRVLGADIAEKLGTVGYLETLIRTRVGKFLLEDSITLENFKLTWKSCTI